MMGISGCKNSKLLWMKTNNVLSAVAIEKKSWKGQGGYKAFFEPVKRFWLQDEQLGQSGLENAKFSIFRITKLSNM